MLLVLSKEERNNTYIKLFIYFYFIIYFIVDILDHIDHENIPRDVLYAALSIIQLRKKCLL